MPSSVSRWDTAPHRRPMALMRSLVALLTLSAIGLACYLLAGQPRTPAAPDVSLVDQNARPFTLAAQRGHPVVLLFGYTHCPDECPTVLARLGKAVRAPGVAHDVRIAFVTVDPARDTPGVLKRYIGLFDPAFFALTGSRTQLQSAYAAYRVQRRVERGDGSAAGYSVTHSTALFYIGRDGSIGTLGNFDDSIADIAHALHAFH